MFSLGVSWVILLPSPWHPPQEVAALLGRRAGEVGAGAEDLAIVAAYRAALLGEPRAGRRPQPAN